MFLNTALLSICDTLSILFFRGLDIDLMTSEGPLSYNDTILRCCEWGTHSSTSDGWRSCNSLLKLSLCPTFSIYSAYSFMIVWKWKVLDRIIKKQLNTNLKGGVSVIITPLFAQTPVIIPPPQKNHERRVSWNPLLVCLCWCSSTVLSGRSSRATLLPPSAVSMVPLSYQQLLNIFYCFFVLISWLLALIAHCPIVMSHTVALHCLVKRVECGKVSVLLYYLCCCLRGRTTLTPVSGPNKH